MKLGLVFSVVLVVGGTLCACGGSDDSGGGTATGGTSSGGTSSGGSAGSSSGGSSATGGSSSGGSSATGGSSSGGQSGGSATGGTGGGGDPLAECKSQAASQPNPACANCACDNCLNELIACQQDPTCVALRDCALAANCCDEICVLLNCGSQLQAAGGIGGPGANKAIAVRDCSETAQCNCC